jgi:GTPase
MSTTPAPVVAVVGRPNVGKSTLFNRIVGRQVAIVEEKAGVTRDRKLEDAEWLGVPFRVMDTGGWLPGGTTLDQKVSRQSEKAVREADVVLFVVDATVGITDEDSAAAAWLRETRRPVLLVANKADNDRRDADAWELLGLGFGEPRPLSALHGRNVGDLLDEVLALIDHGDDEDVGDGEIDGDAAPSGIPGVAIVGRPNVGKSTLFNRLIGDDRSVVHDMPGTTRDAVDTVVDTPDGQLRFIDTAGMRRRSKIDEGTEYYSLVRALRALDTADVALLVIDATEGITHQDQRLAERIDAAGCPVIVVLNKWELLDAEARSDVTTQIQRRLAFVGDAPIVKLSALTGKNVHKLLPHVTDAIERYHRRVATKDVNTILAAAQAAQPAPHGGRILYGLQGASDPPTFTLFANKEIAPAYLRYIERKLREEFDLGAVPVKLRVRTR